jgi:hypothetical protein
MEIWVQNMTADAVNSHILIRSEGLTDHVTGLAIGLHPKIDRVGGLTLRLTYDLVRGPGRNL